tara:strand:+ start:2924 stop:3049 length:126 start_codon:yes stop_codon:yes gene_type:complete
MKLKRIINKYGFFQHVPEETPVVEKPEVKKAPVKKKAAKKK